jgi:uncharacterized protein (DUF1778 family)
MSKEKRRKRGGSESAKEAGLTGVVVHFTPEQRRLVGMAAAAASAASVKAFCATAVLAEAEKIMKKERDSID